MNDENREPPVTSTARGDALSLPARAQELLQVIIANLPIALYIVQDGKFQMVSPAFEKISGYTQAELLGMNSLQVVHPEDREMVRQNAIRMLKGELTSPYEFRIVTKEGEPKWVMENIASIQHQGRRATLGKYMDITAHKQADARLLRLNEVLRLIRGVNQLVTQVDTEPELLQKACEWLVSRRNYRLAWIGFVQKDSYDIVPVAQAGFETGYLSSIKVTWDDSEYGRGAIGTAIRTESPDLIHDVESDPRFRPFAKMALRYGLHSAFAAPLKVDNRVIGVLTLYASEPDAFDEEEVSLLTELARDISLSLEKIRQREAHRRSEELYRKIAENIRDGLRIIEDRKVVYVNDQACVIFGYPRDELMRLTVLDLAAPEEKERLAKIMAEARQTGALPDELSFWIVRKDGTRRYITNRHSPLGADNRLVVTTDVTAHQQMEEQLRCAAQEWRTTFDSITDFVSVHDRECRIMRVNKSLADALHLRPAELVGRNCWEAIHGRSGPICDCPHLTAIRTGKVASMETFEPRFGMHVNVTASPIFDGKGAVIGTVHIMKDITERKKAEEAVRRANQFQETVLNSTNDAVSLIDARDYRILGVNHAFLKQYGVKKAEVIGRMCYEVIRHYPKPCDQLGAVCPFLDTVIKGQPSTTVRVRHDNAGEEVHLEIATFPVKDETGNVIQVVEVARDVTERHKAEDVFRTVADNSPIGILIIQQGIIRYINPLAAHVLGWTEQEIIGMEAASLIHPEDREMERGNAIRVLKGEAAPPYEFRVITRNGDVTWVVEKLASIRHEGQRATLASLMDITELKLADKALRDSAEKLRLIFDCVADGIAVTDMAMNIDEVNEAALRLYGSADKAELIGRNAFDLIAEKDRAAAENGIRTTLERGYSGRIGLSLLGKDGRQFPVELNASILRDGSFKPIGFVGIIEDVSERQAIEEQLMIADRLASIGELASGVAHELNNPLTSVIGFSQLLLEKELPDNIRQEVEIIAKESQRAARVVKNLLTFARKHAPARQPADVNAIIEKVLELRAYEQQVSNITVVTRLAPDLPEIMVDDFQVQQVFFNIIVNAEYFMLETHGKGTLTINTERAGRTVRASFADDGPGIPAGNVEHIFDPFFTTKGIGKGTGLGLSICHGIVTSHGGRIYAESEPGKGTTFIVELPVSGQ